MSFLVERPGHPLKFVMVDQMEPGDVKVEDKEPEPEQEPKAEQRTISVKKHKRNG